MRQVLNAVLILLIASSYRHSAKSAEPASCTAIVTRIVQESGVVQTGGFTVSEKISFKGPGDTSFRVKCLDSKIPNARTLRLQGTLYTWDEDNEPVYRLFARIGMLLTGQPEERLAASAGNCIERARPLTGSNFEIRDTLHITCSTLFGMNLDLFWPRNPSIADGTGPV